MTIRIRIINDSIKQHDNDNNNNNNNNDINWNFSNSKINSYDNMITRITMLIN